MTRTSYVDSFMIIRVDHRAGGKEKVVFRGSNKECNDKLRELESDRKYELAGMTFYIEAHDM